MEQAQGSAREHTWRQEVIETGTVIVTQRIAASREAVFPFLIDAEKMLRWMGTEARLEPTVGGEFWVIVNGSDTAIGTFTEVSPPERVVFTWGWDGSEDVPPGSSTVTITLQVDGDDTVVELRHDGLTSAMQVEHRKGWDHFVPLLAVALGGDSSFSPD